MKIGDRIRNTLNNQIHTVTGFNISSDTVEVDNYYLIDFAYFLNHYELAYTKEFSNKLKELTNEKV